MSNVAHNEDPRPKPATSKPKKAKRNTSDEQPHDPHRARILARLRKEADAEAQQAYEYRCLINERDAGRENAVPMSAVVAYAVGAAGNDDLVAGLLQEMAIRLRILTAATKGDPGLLTDTDFGAELAMLERRAETAYEIVRRIGGVDRGDSARERFDRMSESVAAFAAVPTNLGAVDIAHAAEE